MHNVKQRISELRQRHTDAVVRELRQASKTGATIKYTIIALSSVLAIAQFFAPVMTAVHYVGIGASIGIALFTVAGSRQESSAAEELAIAAESVALSGDMLKFEPMLDAFQTESNRSDSLINANRLAFEFFEASAVSSANEVEMIERLMRVTERAVMIAAGFASERHWTICIHKVDGTGADQVLVQIASHRAVPCSSSEARKFRRGEGVPGLAWTSKRTVAVSDIHDPMHGGAFDLHAGNSRAADQIRYRSVVACPVVLRNAKNPIVWGVVVASYDQPGYFQRTGAAARRITPFALLAASVGAIVRLAATMHSEKSLLVEGGELPRLQSDGSANISSAANGKS